MQSVFFAIWILDVVFVILFAIYLSGLFIVKIQIEPKTYIEQTFKTNLNAIYEEKLDQMREQKLQRHIEQSKIINKNNNIINGYDIEQAMKRIIIKTKVLQIEEESQQALAEIKKQNQKINSSSSMQSRGR